MFNFILCSHWLPPVPSPPGLGSQYRPLHGWLRWRWRRRGSVRFFASIRYNLLQFVAFCCSLHSFQIYVHGFLKDILGLWLGRATSHGVAVGCERRRNDTVASNSCSRRLSDRESGCQDTSKMDGLWWFTMGGLYWMLKSGMPQSLDGSWWKTPKKKRMIWGGPPWLEPHVWPAMGNL